jgi:Homeodomain-like domain
MGRPNMALTSSPSERSQLGSILRSRSLPHSLVRRAQIVLLSADGAANRAVARRCGVSAPVVSLWRQQSGVAGLHAELRSGRPRSHSDEQEAALLLHSKPAVATHWSVRSAYRHLQKHGRALLRAVRAATTSQQELQAVH